MMTTRLCRYFSISLICVTSFVIGFPHFPKLIPNGYNVVNPCKNSAKWIGVGHENIDGGGSLNPFGKDFYQFGKIWTENLCQADSDRDGRTNGEELGDPQCKWNNPSNQSLLASNTSHPGICEPLNNSKCTDVNSWLQCETELRCEALKAPDVKNFTLRLPETTVPPQETTYICMVFNVPSDADYDIIAGIPVLNNTDVIHHMLIYGCEMSVLDSELKSSPFQCGMGSRSTECVHLVAAWALGSEGFCLPEQTAIRIGLNHYKRMMVQLHWTNFEKKTDRVDSSGMMFFYTTRKRAYEIGMLSIGQMYLEIPPGGKTVNFTGGCTSFCSKKYMTGPLNVMAAFNHMHYLGRSQEISVIRDGVMVHKIAQEDNYDFDRLKIFWRKEPIQIYPGDEISTTCTFQSKHDSNKTIYFGEETKDEMCFGFLLYYPKSNFPGGSSCQSWKSVPMCKVIHMRVMNEEIIVDGCDVSNFSSNTSLRQMTETLQNCSGACSEKIRSIRNSPCLKNDIWAYMRHEGISSFQYGQSFLKAVDNCSKVWDRTCQLLSCTSNIVQVTTQYLIIVVHLSAILVKLV